MRLINFGIMLIKVNGRAGTRMTRVERMNTGFFILLCRINWIIRFFAQSANDPFSSVQPVSSVFLHAQGWQPLANFPTKARRPLSIYFDISFFVYFVP